MARALLLMPITTVFADYFSQSNDAKSYAGVDGLIDSIQNEFDLDGLLIVSSQHQIEKSIASLQSLLVANELQENLLNWIACTTFQPIFHMYIKSLETKSHLTQDLLSLLQVMLRIADTMCAIKLLKRLCTDSVEKRCCIIKSGPNGGLIFVRDINNV